MDNEYTQVQSCQIAVQVWVNFSINAFDKISSDFLTVSKGRGGFNEQIFACVDRALSKLGSGVALAFYYRIETQHNLSRKEIESRPMDFLHHLEDMLGPAGFSVIERLITKEIVSSFNVTISPNSTLNEVVEEARKNFLI